MNTENQKNGVSEARKAKPFASAVRRAGIMGARDVRRRLSSKFLEDAIGPITRGCEIVTLSKGQYSVIDLLEHCLGYTGPVDLLVSTWNISPNDARYLSGLRDAGKLLNVRLILDGSFARREPESNAWLQAQFGAESMRATVNHAKFIVMRNQGWNISIRTSANLNENLRMEVFEVSDCKLIASLFSEYADEVFALHTSGDTRVESEVKFKHGRIFGEALDEQSAARRMEGEFAESSKFFGTGKYDVDLRRVGRSFSK